MKLMNHEEELETRRSEMARLQMELRAAREQFTALTPRFRALQDGVTKDKHAEHGDDAAQEQEVGALRSVLLLQTHLKTWQSSRLLKDDVALERPSRDSLLSQETPMSLRIPPPEAPKTEAGDTSTQLEIPLQWELLQSLPVLLAPRITEKLEQISKIGAPVPITPGSNWLWPTIIILSTIAVGLVNFVLPGSVVRPIIVMWFLFVCPGMALVRFLRLHEPLVEWALALALSFAIDAIVAGIQLYAGKWSPISTLIILMGLSLASAIVQPIAMRFAAATASAN